MIKVYITKEQNNNNEFVSYYLPNNIITNINIERDGIKIITSYKYDTKLKTIVVKGASFSVLPDNPNDEEYKAFCKSVFLILKEIKIKQEENEPVYVLTHFGGGDKKTNLEKETSIEQAHNCMENKDKYPGMQFYCLSTARESLKGYIDLNANPINVPTDDKLNALIKLLDKERYDFNNEPSFIWLTNWKVMCQAILMKNEISVVAEMYKKYRELTPECPEKLNQFLDDTWKIIPDKVGIKKEDIEKLKTICQTSILTGDLDGLISISSAILSAAYKQKVCYE